MVEYREALSAKSVPAVYEYPRNPLSNVEPLATIVTEVESSCPVIRLDYASIVLVSLYLLVALTLLFSGLPAFLQSHLLLKHIKLRIQLTNTA